MKIIHIISSLSGGGRERRMLQLVKGLDDLGYEQCVICLFDAVDYDLSAYGSVIFVTSPSQSRKNILRTIFSTISSFRPDIVHNWADVPLVLYLVSFLKYRFHYSYIAGYIASALKTKMISNAAIAEKINFISADKIISNSKKGLICHRAPEYKSIVIQNGFDYSRFEMPVDVEAMRSSLNISAKFIVGMFARMCEQKDWDMFLKLAKICSNRDVYFLACGKGELLDYYLQQASVLGLNNVKFLGFRHDSDNIVRVCDVGVLFTNINKHEEGISNAIMEFLAAGKPVIATDCGGTPEIVQNGVNGYLVNPSDAEQAASILVSIFEDSKKYSYLSQNARQTIINDFQLSSMVKKYINVYESCSVK